MVRRELIAKLAAENPKLTQAQAEKAVDAICGAIIRHLEQGGRVELRRLGNFHVTQIAGRLGRHPRTGEYVHTGPKAVARFRASRLLQQRMNSE
ncbi:HU family DNA-binding protein [Pontitalea aquivivens]|uniref:HU family DNA-binding protein n=1 Tax=Pontitalea aquivivens TaxID=3388663 RepID=UPI00397094F5